MDGGWDTCGWISDVHPGHAHIVHPGVEGRGADGGVGGVGHLEDDGCVDAVGSVFGITYPA